MDGELKWVTLHQQVMRDSGNLWVCFFCVYVLVVTQTGSVSQYSSCALCVYCSECKLPFVCIRDITAFYWLKCNYMFNQHISCFSFSAPVDFCPLCASGGSESLLYWKPPSDSLKAASLGVLQEMQNVFFLTTGHLQLTTTVWEKKRAEKSVGKVHRRWINQQARVSRSRKQLCTQGSAEASTE